MKKSGLPSAFFIVAVVLASCSVPPPAPIRVPAMEYANRIKSEQGIPVGWRSAPRAQAALDSGPEAKARVRLVSDDLPSETYRSGDSEAQLGGGPEVVTNLGPGVRVEESNAPNIRDYIGPLSVGDPGQSASLWKESRGGNLLFRDYRAWQPLDLITIVVTEDSTAKNKADTSIKQESTIAAAITALFGLESTVKRTNPQVQLGNLVNGDLSSDYKGEGETKREGTLKARISAMVAEVLPSGVLRIEGEKIISVNNEDQHMVISGLVRPEDVNSNNEVSSSKIANVRIDYFGKGTVGDAQQGGWLARIIRRLWPL